MEEAAAAEEAEAGVAAFGSRRARGSSARLTTGCSSHVRCATWRGASQARRSLRSRALLVSSATADHTTMPSRRDSRRSSSLGRSPTCSER